MQKRRSMPHGVRAATPVFTIQPLAQSVSGVVVHGSVRLADRAEAEVVAPATEVSN